MLGERHVAGRGVRSTEGDAYSRRALLKKRIGWMSREGTVRAWVPSESYLTQSAPTRAALHAFGLASSALKPPAGSLRDRHRGCDRLPYAPICTDGHLARSAVCVRGRSRPLARLRPAVLLVLVPRSCSASCSTPYLMTVTDVSTKFLREETIVSTTLGTCLSPLAPPSFPMLDANRGFLDEPAAPPTADAESRIPEIYTFDLEAVHEKRIGTGAEYGEWMESERGSRRGVEWRENVYHRYDLAVLRTAKWTRAGRAPRSSSSS
ncbi:hypothetical protein C8R45DRAFT_1102820 [Mycena sanguinolenta]|nr:hypothetical protein C8R45DRAFT_1102820 [Mycena sanguinolenta]